MPLKRSVVGAVTVALAASWASWSVSAPLRPASFVSPLATSCALPLVHDIYDGFRVGVPAGWDVSTMGGEISVEPNPASPEGAVLYPTLLTKNLTAGKVFSTFMHFEQQLVRRTESVFSYQVQTRVPGMPSASVLADVKGVMLGGEIEHLDGDAVLARRAAWAGGPGELRRLHVEGLHAVRLSVCRSVRLSNLVQRLRLCQGVHEVRLSSPVRYRVSLGQKTLAIARHELIELSHRAPFEVDVLA